MKQPTTYVKAMPKEKGYMALTSVIIMFAILVTLVLTLSLSGFFNRSNVLDGYFKEQSLAAAEACVEEALLKLAEDPNYTGDETLEIKPNVSCQIWPVLLFGEEKEVRTSAQVDEAISRVLVRVDAEELTLVSWEELGEF